jgi:hypothetical protein
MSPRYEGKPIDEVVQDRVLLVGGEPQLLADELEGGVNIAHRDARLGLDLSDLGVDEVPIEEGGHSVASLLDHQVQRGVAGEGHAVVADLDGDLWGDREAAVPDLAVADHESGEDQRIVRAAQPGKRAAVVLEQPRRVGGDLGGADLDVHAFLGQIAAGDLGVHPSAADTIQHCHQHVEIVGDLVLLGEHRACDARLVTLAAQGADQIALGRLVAKPGVDVVVTSRWTCSSRIRRRYWEGIPNLSARPPSQVEVGRNTPRAGVTPSRVMVGSPIPSRCRCPSVCTCHGPGRRRRAWRRAGAEAAPPCPRGGRYGWSTSIPGSSSRWFSFGFVAYPVPSGKKTRTRK